MSSSFLIDLNPMQQQAVTFPEGNLLVLAGAGSGKTRVLVHRIGWLLSQGISLHNILAVTFTNKAATEMRGRLEQMLQRSLAPLWVGTFHGIAHRLLRLHWQEAELDQSFQIIDAEDQARLLKRIHKMLGLDPEQWPVKQSQIFINNNKEKGLRANRLAACDSTEITLIKIYQMYEDGCNRSSLVDFSELLLRSYELWKNNQQLRESYQERFQHILVDEFQDTNAIQYGWIRLLSGANSNLTAVGDDDQSIYSWRGADSGNMQRLSKDYSNVNIIRLEQNYRSTATILKAANSVITHNSNRLGKSLWTECGDGEPIVLYAAFNEIDEARYIADKVQAWVNHDGGILNDVAILYRSNAQSRVIEEQLLRAGIPYRVYGGVRFFERAEIKDVLAYLRLLVNHDDDAAFERVVNLPMRGLGEATLILLREYARTHSCSLWQAGQTMVTTEQLTARPANGLRGFMRLIEEGEAQIAKLALAELVRFIINLTNLSAHYAKPQYNEYKQSRLENLDELITAAEQFSALICDESNPQTVLNTFLAHVTLEAGDYTESSDNCVKLMTLHAAKGLEFPLVFLCGMEEGLFPHIMSLGKQKDLEEERRLCYVGMTRAMRKLYLLYAESRQLHGSTTMRRSSRFLREIPQELIKSSALLNSVKPALDDVVLPTTSANSANKFDVFCLGKSVFHQDFGEGVITGFEGQGEFMLVRVNFKRAGSKLLSLQYAQLKII